LNELGKFSVTRSQQLVFTFSFIGVSAWAKVSREVEAVGTFQSGNFITVNAQNVFLTVFGVRNELNSIFWAVFNIFLIVIIIIWWFWNLNDMSRLQLHKLTLIVVIIIATVQTVGIDHLKEHCNDVSRHLVVQLSFEVDWQEVFISMKKN
jgi:hypothetical protein